jgi:hypothetical protein
VVSFPSRGSPRAERVTMPVNIGQRELIAALGTSAQDV